MTTNYRVFKKMLLPPATPDEDAPSPGEAWVPVRDIDANSATHAVRQVATELGDAAHDVTFAAAPSRSWLETTVTVEATPKVKLS